MIHTESAGSEREDTFPAKGQMTSSEKEKFQPQAKKQQVGNNTSFA